MSPRDRTMFRHFRALCLAVLASVPFNAVAASGAQALLDDYEKSDVIKMLLHHCAGEITVNKPFPKRRYGRPPESQVDARTLGHDMDRCKFTADDARAWFDRKNARVKNRDGTKVIRNNSTGSKNPYASGSGPTLKQRMRDLERRERERRYKEERRKAEGRAQVAQQKSQKEVEAEIRNDACQMARKMHRWARDNASAATTVKEREKRQAKVDALQQKIYQRCS